MAPSPPLWLGACFATSLVLLAFAGRFAAAWRWVAGTAAACLFALVLWHPFAPEVRAGALEVTAIDVGQGDSLFLAYPDGRLMLLDTGGRPSYDGRTSTLDIGEDVVSPYLWTRSVKRLDVVALSHLHADHAGGLAAILRNFRPKEVWTGALPESSQGRQLAETVRQYGARLRLLNAGDTPTIGGARIDVLAPETGRRPEAASDQDSLVLRLQYGDRSFLLTGDMPGQVERRLVEHDEVTRTDVLKVPHHGSRTSTGDQFLDRVRPAFAVISVGFANSYNHPHPQLLDRLARKGATTLRTDRMGQIRIITDGRRLEVFSGLPLALR
jgi:competence protein ComEC